ncbi:MAG: class B sortase [Erysipelotrichaceae bacterium]
MNNIKKYLNKLLFVICVICLLFSTLKLISIGLENKEEKDYKDNINNIVSIPDANKESGDVNFKELKKLNSKINSYIKIPNTEITFPIIKGEDNDFYLNHNLEDQINNYGSIYMDFRNDSNYKDFNTYIYGHNVMGGGMFSELENYENVDFIKNHKKMYLFTEKENFDLEVFAVYSGPITDGSYFVNNHSNQKELNDYLFKLKKQCLYFDDSVKLSINDHIVTLFTCSLKEGLDSDLRITVFARIIPNK